MIRTGPAMMKRPPLEAKLSGLASQLAVGMAVGVVAILVALPRIADFITEQTGKIPEYATAIHIGLGVAGTVGLISVFPIYIIWLERKVAAHIQDRLGPMRVGWHGILQGFADGIKLLFKEDLIPNGADKVMFKFAPILVIMGAFAAFAVLPWDDGMVIADLNIGILYVLAITSLGAIGVLMAGWGSNNKYALLGGMRSAAQMVSYEIPTAIAALVVIVQVGTLDLQQIVAIQQQNGWLIWHFFPLNFITFVIFFICGLAETNRTPFDLPEAESELVAGFHTEYSGMRFAFFFLAEYGAMFLVSALAVVLFFGGWNGPFVSGPIVLFAKGVFLVFVQMWLRWTLPRLRVDQLMALCWKYLIPISFVLLISTAYFKVAGIGWFGG